MEALGHRLGERVLGALLRPRHQLLALAAVENRLPGHLIAGRRPSVRHSTGGVIRSFEHADFPLELLLERKRSTLSVVLPAREVADTVGPIVERILALEGLVDQVLVVDADSSDGSAEVAARAGAEVRRQASSCCPSSAPCSARATPCTARWPRSTGDLVMFIDSDTRDFEPHFVTGLAGPLIAGEGVRFVKASYRRPFVARRRRAARRRRPGEPAHRAPAAGGVLPGPGGPAPAAGGRGGGPARGARADPVRHRLCGGDGDAARRPRRRWARTPSRRWTSASGATTTSRWRRCGRWRTPCSPRCASGCAATGACSMRRRARADRGAPAVRLAARRRLMALRCVYTDIDGTLRRRRRLAVPRRRGRVHAAARPRAGGMPPRRRGGGAEVGPAQGAGDGGRAADRPERVHLRGGLGRGDRRGGEPALRRVRAARRADAARADRRHRGARPAGALRSRSSRTRRGTPAASSRTCTGAGGRGRRERAARSGGPGRPAAGRQRRRRGGRAHLPPDPGRRRRRPRRWSCTCARGGSRPRSASRWGTRSRTSAWRRWWAASSWWPTARPRRRGRTSTRTESGFGDGFYEAVVQSLVQ